MHIHLSHSHWKVTPNKKLFRYSLLCLDNKIFFRDFKISRFVIWSHLFYTFFTLDYSINNNIIIRNIFSSRLDVYSSHCHGWLTIKSPECWFIWKKKCEFTFEKIISVPIDSLPLTGNSTLATKIYNIPVKGFDTGNQKFKTNIVNSIVFACV